LVILTIQKTSEAMHENVWLFIYLIFKVFIFISGWYGSCNTYD